MVCQNEEFRNLLIVAPKNLSNILGELCDAYTSRNILSVLKSYNYTIPNHTDLVNLSKGMDAVLLIGSRKRSPRTVLKAPFLHRPDGKTIPTSWLPVRDSGCVQRFTSIAATVQRRKRQLPSIALLSQRHPRFISLAGRVAEILRGHDHNYPTFEWTSDLLLREEMIRGLGSGLGLAIYFGHGRPIGWVGYYGLRINHFENTGRQPLGALISLCCQTASRKKVGISFAENIVLKGIASASLGAVSDTLHSDNTRWAVRICNSLKDRPSTIGDLVVLAKPLQSSSFEAYRLIGDPFAPLSAPIVGVEIANTIKTYP